ncbi:MAG: CRISPR-associated endonuclease Cas2 [Candidatus Paceibacterota bacterium]
MNTKDKTDKTGKTGTNFVVKFIEAFTEAGKDLYEIWQWQPIYYKGIHVSGPSYKKTYHGFKNLEQRKLIRKYGDGYKFTGKGVRWFEGSLLRYHRFKGTKWDGKWRIVIFDIPEELHKKRNYLRSKLKNLGFHMLQKSVFIIPYPCEEELAGVCRKLKIVDYVDVIKAESAGFREGEFKKLFNLQ